jgi:hypothetical protein
MHFELPWWSVIILASAYGVYKVGDKIRQLRRKKYKPAAETAEPPKPPETTGN